VSCGEGLPPENIDYHGYSLSQAEGAVLKNLQTDKGTGSLLHNSGGFNPGLPSVLVRLAKSHFTRYEKARVV